MTDIDFLKRLRTRDYCGERIRAQLAYEPPAPASRRQCSTRLSYTPTGTGAVVTLRAAPGKLLRGGRADY